MCLLDLRSGGVVEVVRGEWTGKYGRVACMDI